MNINDIYTDYYNRVYYTALKITKEPCSAEDVLQETFIKAYDRFNEVKDASKLGPWLSTIASRMAIDFLRKEKKVVLLSIEAHPLLQPPEVTIGSKVEKECEQIILEEGVKKRISTLSPRLRAVFRLHYDHQLKESEIASNLHISRSAVKSRLHRARLVMKDKMSDELNQYYTA